MISLKNLRKYRLKKLNTLFKTATEDQEYDALKEKDIDEKE